MSWLIWPWSHVGRGALYRVCGRSYRQCTACTRSPAAGTRPAGLWHERRAARALANGADRCGSAHPERRWQRARPARKTATAQWHDAGQRSRKQSERRSPPLHRIRSASGRFSRRPGAISGVRNHCFGEPLRIRAQILFTHDVILVDDEAHHARGPVRSGIGDGGYAIARSW